MTNEEQKELEKKALDQFMSGKSLFGKDGAFAPMLKNFIEKWSSYLCCYIKNSP